MEPLLDWAAGVLLMVGVAVITLGVYGMVWMPDLYARLHAASKAVVLGIVPLLLALSFTGEAAILSRATLIGAFLLITTPVASHAIGRAAFVAREPMVVPDCLDESGHLMGHLPRREIPPRETNGQDGCEA